MPKKKLPRWYRILRYNINCLWYHVIMPLGVEEDILMRDMKGK